MRPSSSKRRPWAAALVLCSIAAPSVARAGWWSLDRDSDHVGGRLRFSTRVSFWVGTFDRPDRACKSADIGGYATVVPDTSGAEVVLPGSLGGLGYVDPCWSEASEEVGVGVAAELAFLVREPFYLTGAVELLYTFPDRDYVLRNQVIVPVSLGVMVTWPEWTFRPILAAKLTPVLYLTDDTRDFTGAGELGVAWSLGGWGDMAFTVTKHFAETLDGWQVTLGVSPR